MDLSVHNIKKVHTGVTKLEKDDGTPFYVRHIRVRTDKDTYLDLSLFSDKEHTLEVVVGDDY